MSYPKDSPRSKHDLCCPASLSSSLQNNNALSIQTLDELTTNLVQSSLQTEPSSPPRLATVYTYKDAPVKPKPLSGKLRIENLMSFLLFERIARSEGGSLKKCTIAVKLPSVMEQYAHYQRKYQADKHNTNSFRSFIGRLHSANQVAVLAYDSAGWIAFLVPFSLLNHQQQSNGDDSQYAACLFYAPMKEFLSHAQNNHGLNEPQSLETWTPRYSPPPEEECGPSVEWDRQVETLATWTHL
jgi:hypothetical protein